MADLEKVIKGLECCLVNGHNNCPYKSTDEGIDKVTSCTTYLMKDALALLKAQEPRVMTLEELKSCDRETVWFQVKSDNTMQQLTQDGIAALIFIGSLHNWNGYGTVWRCWTARPTDEQREVAKWDD